MLVVDVRSAGAKRFLLHDHAFVNGCEHLVNGCEHLVNGCEHLVRNLKEDRAEGRVVQDVLQNVLRGVPCAMPAQVGQADRQGVSLPLGAGSLCVVAAVRRSAAPLCRPAGASLSSGEVGQADAQACAVGRELQFWGKLV